MAKGDQKVTQTSNPWKVARPFLTDAMRQGEHLFQSGEFSPSYGGDRVAGFGPGTMQAQDMVRQQAGAGAPLVGQAGGTLSRMMTGDMPALDAVKDRALATAIPAATAMFSGAGMTNSTAAMDHVADAAVRAVAPYEYGAHENAAARAMQAAGMAPGIDAAGYLPSRMMASVGAQEDALAQAMINAEREQFMEQQPVANFQGYLNSLLPFAGMGGTTSQTQPGQSPASTFLSSGLGGLGTYGALMMNPATAPFAAIGGIGAGLAGLL